MTPDDLAGDKARHDHFARNGLPPPAVPWEILQEAERDRWRKASIGAPESAHLDEVSDCRA